VQQQLVAVVVPPIANETSERTDKRGHGTSALGRPCVASATAAVGATLRNLGRSAIRVASGGALAFAILAIVVGPGLAEVAEVVEAVLQDLQHFHLPFHRPCCHRPCHPHPDPATLVLMLK